MSLWGWMQMEHLREVQRQCEARWRLLPAGPVTVESTDAAPLRHPDQSLATLTGQFTPEQYAQLVALRQRAEVLRLSDAVGLDAHRLRFARWLVEHDYLNEDR